MDDAAISDRLWRLVDTARSHAETVLAEVPPLIAAAENDGRTEHAALGWCAAGLAHRQLGQLDRAIDAFDRAEHLNGARENDNLAVRILMGRAATHLFLGDTERCLADLARAEGRGDAEHVIHLRAQRGTVLHKLGHLSEAADNYRAVLAAAGVPAPIRAMVMGNYGLLAVHLGDFAVAADALRDAERLNRELDEVNAVVDAIHNQAYLAACIGDVPAAVASYRRSTAARVAAKVPLGVDLIDLGLLWLSVGLFEDALEQAELAEDGLRARKMHVELGDAVLLRARALLGRGQAQEARQAAEEAVELFRAEGRHAWGAAAGYTVCLSRYRAGERSVALADDAGRVADELASIGWAVAACEANLLAGQAGLVIDVSLARTRLERVVADGRSPVPELRLAYWHALALLRQNAGDQRGALAAVRAGLAEIHRQRAGVGSPEVQATISHRIEEFATIAFDLVGDRGPQQLLRWAENCRSGSMRLADVRVDGDDTMRLLFADRRLAVHEAQAALDAGDVVAYVRHAAARSRIERAIRSHSRGTFGGAGSSLRGISRRDLSTVLGDREFVEFVDDRHGRLLAVVRHGNGRLRRVVVGATNDVHRAVERLRFAVRRFLAEPGHDGLGQVEQRARQLDDLLVQPLGLRGAGPALIVPGSRLFAVPWGLLSSLQDRPVTVVPSAAVLVTSAAAARPPDLGPPVLAAGPGLRHANREVRECSRSHADAVVLTSSRATAARVLRHMEGAAIAHLACHGRFRPEHPWFSELRLTAGDLTVHELQLLRRTPWVVILAACDVGTNAATSGDEALGFVAALLACGTSALVASPLPVLDEASCTFMTALHRYLAREVDPDVALLAARHEVRGGSAVEGVTAGSFVTYGTGYQLNRFADLDEGEARRAHERP